MVDVHIYLHSVKGICLANTPPNATGPPMSQPPGNSHDHCPSDSVGSKFGGLVILVDKGSYISALVLHQRKLLSKHSSTPPNAIKSSITTVREKQIQSSRADKGLPSLCIVKPTIKTHSKICYQSTSPNFFGFYANLSQTHDMLDSQSPPH